MQTLGGLCIPASGLYIIGQQAGASGKAVLDVFQQVIAVCKSADLLLMVLDATKPWYHKEILTRELESVGMRLNRSPPHIYFKKRKTGGVSINSTLQLTRMDEKMVLRILQEYKIHNCEVSASASAAAAGSFVTSLGGVLCTSNCTHGVLHAWTVKQCCKLISFFVGFQCCVSMQLLFKEDASVDDLIDVIEGNRRYIRCLYVYNKVFGHPQYVKLTRMAKRPWLFNVSSNGLVLLTVSIFVSPCLQSCVVAQPLNCPCQEGGERQCPISNPVCC